MGLLRPRPYRPGGRGLRRFQPLDVHAHPGAGAGLKQRSTVMEIVLRATHDHTKTRTVHANAVDRYLKRGWEHLPQSAEPSTDEPTGPTTEATPGSTPALKKKRFGNKSTNGAPTASTNDPEENA